MRISDWSSDVCSSDLYDRAVEHRLRDVRHPLGPHGAARHHPAGAQQMKLASTRNLLTPGEQAVLDLIRDNPDQLTRRDIVERLESTTSSIAVIIKKLRRRGFPITSPRIREPGGKRIGVPQTYRH